MRQTLLLAAMLALLPGVCFVRAEDKSVDPQVEEALKATRPGPAHQQLAKRAGEYTTVTKFWSDPAKAPTETKGTASIKVILEGRFISEEFSGSIDSQTPYTAVRLTGYNNANGHYEGSWASTVSTSLLKLDGESKDDGKTVVFTATFEGEMEGKQTITIITKQTDVDHFTVEFFAKENPGANDKPMMRTEYARKK